jgi:methylated-DNA-protein-cysteine methyltransferase-like protein
MNGARTRAASAFRSAVLDVVRQIPCGRVCTYGDVAHLSGYPGAARAVGRVLASATDNRLPYHRVIGAGGVLGGYGSGQAFKAARLAAEGLVVGRGRVAGFMHCRWTGTLSRRHGNASRPPAV